MIAPIRGGLLGAEHRSVVPRPVRDFAVPAIDLKQRRADERHPDVRIARSVHRGSANAGERRVPGGVRAPIARSGTHTSCDAREQREPRDDRCET